MERVALDVDVPVATFRDPRRVEYAKSYSYPPHSTVWGLLLSLVGETNESQHVGAELALAMLSQPAKSKVLRTVHRFKSRREGDLANKRPDYREILTDIRFTVWVGRGKDANSPCLAERIRQATLDPALIERWGVLYLGESDDLVNSINLVPDDRPPCLRSWLIKDDTGDIVLPYWADRFNFQGTRFRRYRLQLSIKELFVSFK